MSRSTLSMSPNTANVTTTIHKAEVNGPLCQQFRDEMRTELAHLLGHLEHMPAESRPQLLPSGSVFLVAEAQQSSNTLPKSTSASQPELSDTHAIAIASLCLLPLPLPSDSSALTKNLPPNARIGELKRVLTRPAFRRQGVQKVLMAAIEDIARRELGMDLLVLETLHTLPGAQRMYEACRWKRRGVFGCYDEEYSACYEKWL